MADVTWTAGAEFEDIRYELSGDGIAKITIDRPEVRNAFRPQTVIEMSRAFELAREDPGVGVIILTGEGEKAFCSGGDQRVRGDRGYEEQPGSGVGRFHVTDLHVQTDRMAAQQLLFTLSPRILADHGQLIARTLDRAGDRAWQKLVVAEALKAEFMRRLRTMNITARTLFPGLDGVGRAIGELVSLEAGRRGQAGSLTQVASL